MIKKGRNSVGFAREIYADLEQDSPIAVYNAVVRTISEAVKLANEGEKNKLKEMIEKREDGLLFDFAQKILSRNKVGNG